MAYDFGPKVDDRYLSYKTIELSCCKFISEYEATPTSISHWLGQGIREMESAEKHGSCCFKVEKTTCNVSWKGKYSELDSEDTKTTNHTD